MSLDPHNLLACVHPDLVKVLHAAAQAPQPFQVTYGLRTQEAEDAAVAAGKSETKHSRHLACARYDGTAMAIDFACVTSEGLTWKVSDDSGGVYHTAANQIMAAAESLGVKIQWGGQQIGAWVDGQVSHFRDWDHIQLDPSAYP